MLEYARSALSRSGKRPVTMGSAMVLAPGSGFEDEGFRGPRGVRERAGSNLVRQAASPRGPAGQRRVLRAAAMSRTSGSASINAAEPASAIGTYDCQADIAPAPTSTSACPAA